MLTISQETCREENHVGSDNSIGIKPEWVPKARQDYGNNIEFFSYLNLRKVFVNITEAFAI